ncbi:MAG: ribonuclease R [Lachnospiraceae bacterium]|nr:ribonuclease R [Lachnospiraceae bacterium]MDY5742016.1 ribonuclease R [Lachnospiraceae bacterium]
MKQKREKRTGRQETGRGDRKALLLHLMGEAQYRPMKQKELALLLQVKSEDRELLTALLDELVREGKAELNKRGRYSLAKSKMMEGRYLGHPNGFGFVEVEGEAEDIFIPEGNEGTAFHNDTVRIEVCPQQTGRRRIGQVVKLLERNTKTLVGLYKVERGRGLVRPDKNRYPAGIRVTKGGLTAEPMDKVVLELQHYGDKRRLPEGKIIRVIGKKGAAGVDMEALLYQYELNEVFPAAVEDQAEALAQKPITEAQLAGRLDLRSELIITIDGEDAKDLDDAISLTETDDGYRLGVHIADVAEYVKEGSALDSEALRRGTSVYLPDRVLPMLPQALSNGSCSLHPGEPKLALSCLMEVDHLGRVVGHEICETVIESRCRMTYQDVQLILDGDAALRETYAELVPLLERMRIVSDMIRRAREKRGGLQFDFPETKIVLNEQGQPIDIRPYERGVSNAIIEDFMLLANETVAKEYFWRELPFLYRVHAEPTAEKLQDLEMVLSGLGLHIKQSRKGLSHALQQLLERQIGTEREEFIKRLTLRCMPRAQYSAFCEGHFALQISQYSHFTSPIRRYPDLQIHRIIKECLHDRLSEERINHYREILPQVAKWASQTELRADELEREAKKMKMAEYAKLHLGQEYIGMVTSVAEHGIYVMLPNTIEGLIRAKDLPGDYYTFDAVSHRVIGKRSGREFCIGDRLKIVISDVSVLDGKIDFLFIDEEEE